MQRSKMSLTPDLHVIKKDMRNVKQDVETDSDSYHLILWSSSSIDKIIPFSVNGDNETISDGTG